MKLSRAYSILEIKAVDESSDEVVIEGIASTPSADRYGDIVESMGAEFELPLPLLWQHDHEKPVGWVEFAQPTKNGIPFKARLANVTEAGVLKDRVDEARQSLLLKLVKGVSIGFRPLEWEPIKNSNGIRFKRWDWMELSLVTIPANEDATISVVKKYDEEARNALVKSFDRSKTGEDVGVSTPSKSKKVETKTSTNEVKKMNISEQLKELKEKHAAALVRMQELMEKGAEMSDEEDSEYTQLEADCASFEKSIARCESLVKMTASNSSVLDKVTNKAAAQAARPAVRNEPVLKNAGEKGILFASAVQCLLQGKGNDFAAKAYAERQFQGNEVVQNLVKAAVEAGNTSDPNWVGALVGAENTAYVEFVEYLRPRTLVGQFGTGNIPALRQIAFRTPVVNQSSAMTGYWVGEGQAKPLTKASFERTTLNEKKLANIAALTKESIAWSNPGAALLIRDELSKALITTMDQDFINPLKAETAASPASILFGAPNFASTGATAAAIDSDLDTLLGVFLSAQNPISQGVWIMSSFTALRLSSIKNALGQKEYPDMTLAGGTLKGLPVLVSDYVPTTSDGSIIALVNAGDIFLADGAIAVDASEQASLEMSDTPEHNSTTPTPATSLVSMWQTNSVAFRAEKYVNWMRVPGRVGAAYLTGVQY